MLCSGPCKGGAGVGEGRRGGGGSTVRLMSLLHTELFPKGGKGGASAVQTVLNIMLKYDTIDKKCMIPHSVHCAVNGMCDLFPCIHARAAVVGALFLRC